MREDAFHLRALRLPVGSEVIVVSGGGTQITVHLSDIEAFCDRLQDIAEHRRRELREEGR